MRITEKKNRLIFDGVDKFFVHGLMLKFMLYKLAYLYRVSYDEAVSMWKSNAASKITKVVNRPLSKEEREGKF